jgi:hypothetical protein
MSEEIENQVENEKARYLFAQTMKPLARFRLYADAKRFTDALLAFEAPGVLTLGIDDIPSELRWTVSFDYAYKEHELRAFTKCYVEGNNIAGVLRAEKFTMLMAEELE